MNLGSRRELGSRKRMARRPEGTGLQTFKINSQTMSELNEGWISYQKVRQVEMMMKTPSLI